MLRKIGRSKGYRDFLSALRQIFVGITNSRVKGVWHSGRATSLRGIVYLRQHAGTEAINEFQKILDRRAAGPQPNEAQRIRLCRPMSSDRSASP